MNVYGRLEDEQLQLGWEVKDAPVENEEQLEVENSSACPLTIFEYPLFEYYSGCFVSVILPFFLGLISPEQSQDFLYWMGYASEWRYLRRLFWN